MLLLIELVLEFNSHVCGLLSVFAQIQIKQAGISCRERLFISSQWVEAQFDANRLEKGVLKSSRDEKESAYRSGEGGDEPA